MKPPQGIVAGRDAQVRREMSGGKMSGRNAEMSRIDPAIWGNDPYQGVALAMPPMGVRVERL